ncbi:MAG: hypothetical protein ACRCX8_20820 [Sarcina sp.]
MSDSFAVEKINRWEMEKDLNMMIDKFKDKGLRIKSFNVIDTNNDVPKSLLSFESLNTITVIFLLEVM